MRQKLTPFAKEEEIETVIDTLKIHRLLDDSRFSLNFASYGMRERGIGPTRIRSELVRRGVAQELIDQALEAVASEINEEDAATTAFKKYVRKRPPANSPKEYRRLSRYLLRAGFSPEVTRGTLRREGFAEVDWTLD